MHLISLAENQLDSTVTPRPWLDKQLASSLFKKHGSFVTHKVESRSQRPAPLLVPTRLATRLTTTITYPTADAMRATPRTPTPILPMRYFNFRHRRMVVQILAVVCRAQASCGHLHFESMGQTQIAKLEMVPIAFSIGGNIDEAVATDSSRETIYQDTAGSEGSLEGNCPGQLLVIEEYG